MIVRFTILIVVFFYSFLASAEISYYRASILRGTVNETKLVHNFWSGEYPGPIMNLKQSITVNSYSTIENLNETLPCTIEKGLYHPWSEEKTSALQYYTVTNVATFTAQQDSFFHFLYSADDENYEEYSQVILKDEFITDIHGADGEWCLGRFVNSKGESFNIDFNCAELEFNREAFHLTNQVMPENVEQWIQMQCKEGYSSFVSDLELLKSEHIYDGEFLEYGIVRGL